MAVSKERLDKLLVGRSLVASRAKAQAMIMAGEVLVNGQPVVKPGTAVRTDVEIELKQRMPWVSRGGYKLAAALDAFGIDVNGRVCADVGACTGGFTDVLLQGGAALVYAIDVGYGQLDWKLRRDSRVVVMERTNARYLTALPEPVAFACIDVSFISLKLILPAVQQWLAPSADIVALVKPQFEAGRKEVGKGGIVRDAAVHRRVLVEIGEWALAHQLTPAGLLRSPIQGTDGNVEFLLWLRPGRGAALDLTAAIERATSE
ncbi:MAG: TlyA family RNA methyltransferase [Anaerolineae bacterium]